ncbi:MAG: hypothetical protein SFU87_06895 [Chitinophagaceae bacterium]|nr:hypothetical protein [Chitinophagaceae bacterium]
MDNRIYDLFMKENDAWDDMITRHRGEIPTLDKMLNEVMLIKKTVGEETLANVKQLQTEMQVQEKHMDEIITALELQQLMLAKERKIDSDPYGIDTVSSQNILREKIRSAEKTFLELKCNFLNYMATIL